jgi:predicted nucleotidyltransferase
MPIRSSSSAEVNFLDRDRVLEELRRAARQARTAHPEITRVFLFGSLARGDYSASSDADLIVVVRREFEGVLDRAPYQIHTPVISTDTLVYSEAEFERLAADPASFLGRNLVEAIEL